MVKCWCLVYEASGDSILADSTLADSTFADITLTDSILADDLWSSNRLLQWIVLFNSFT